MRLTVLVGLTIMGIAATTAVAATGGGLPNVGTPSMAAQPVYKGYYDHHIDTYLITDVSAKSQAKAYFVKGRAAPGQLTIFGSEPGESDYNPLWDEVWITWKPGVKPVLLGQDDQIKTLAKEGKLTMTDAHIVLNAPILKVGK